MRQLPVIDFETYSEARLQSVGEWAYAEHPSTEVLCLAWNLPGDVWPRLWAPGLPPPAPLFAYIADGGLLEAHKSAFEMAIWHYVCHCRMGWPALPLQQLRDSAAKTAAWSGPRKLETAGEALGLPIQKDRAGHTVMLRLCKPRKPTKNKPWARHTPENSPDDFRALYGYCGTDWESERCLSAAVPELSATEDAVWALDQTINTRGVQVDIPLARACAGLIRDHEERLNQELRTITGGAVMSASCVAELAKFAGVPDATKNTVADALADGVIQGPQRRALEIRQELGMASVKKVFALLDRANSDGRVRGAMTYCGADRTGRWSGKGVQPQNLTPGTIREEDVGWAINDVLAGRDISLWGDRYGLISSLIRPMVRAAPGYELICSDYNAIEARVLAVLAGEEWRLEVFRTHGMIYEESAARISGVPFAEFVRHREETGKHHPLREKLGKVPELASGYQGWEGAWYKFGAGEFMSGEEIKRNILAWRAASPMIPKLWQGLEGAAHRAVWAPGEEHSYRGITYCVQGDVLYCRLPSGRHLNYHRPRLKTNRRGEYGLCYMGTDPKTKRWVEIETYGGKLTENLVQAAARDILALALLRVEAAGYPVVLHVHDEIVCEVPEGFGSVAELEAIMEQRPPWAADWPIKASGGWRGMRYRKG